MASKKRTPRTNKPTDGGQKRPSTKSNSAPAAKPRNLAAAKPQAHGASLEEVSDTDVAEAVLEALAATMVADGTFSPAEKAWLNRFTAAPLFQDVTDKNALIKRTIDRCTREGLEGVLRKAAARLTTEDDREAAFTACFAAALSDGTVTSSELRLIELLRTVFGLSVRRAKELTKP